MSTLDQALNDATAQYLRELLPACGWNITEASKVAGRNRTDLYRLLKLHGISASPCKRLYQKKRTGPLARSIMGEAWPLQ